MPSPSDEPVAGVYALSTRANDYAGLVLVDPGDIDLISDRFTSEPIRDWTPPRMRWETEGGRPIPDFDSVLGGLAFSARAREALADLLEGRGQWLPLEIVDGDDYQVFNLTRVSDALDEDASELVHFASSGRLMRVERYAFDPDRLRGETIFRLSQRPGTFDHVTDTFVRRVEEHELTGFQFKPVWEAAVRQ